LAIQSDHDQVIVRGSAEPGTFILTTGANLDERSSPWVPRSGRFRVRLHVQASQPVMMQVANDLDHRSAPVTVTSEHSGSSADPPVINTELEYQLDREGMTAELRIRLPADNPWIARTLAEPRAAVELLDAFAGQVGLDDPPGSAASALRSHLT
jgi:hypothetical protein